MPPGFVPGAGQQVDSSVPWEIPGGSLFGRWLDTLSAANFHGTKFYRAAGQSDNAMTAVMFNTFTWAVLGSLAGALYIALFTMISALWVWLLSTVHVGMAARVGTMTFSVGLLLWLTCVLVGAAWGFVGPWILGGLHHLVLALFGGVREKGFAHTVRAHAYANGAASVWLAIPVLGLLLALVFHAKNHMQGYAGVHDCGEGKASVAWLMTPVCGLCSCCIAFTSCAALAG